MKLSREGPYPSGRGRARARARLLHAAGAWVQIALGMLLAATATLTLLEAGPAGTSVSWWGGVVGLAASLTLVILGIHGAVGPAVMLPVPPHARMTFPPEDVPVPPLGEFLTQYWPIITADDLQRATERQRISGEQLEGTLLEMGLLTQPELELALWVHTGLMDRWRGVPRDDTSTGQP
jgi:hypothetical protein